MYVCMCEHVVFIYMYVPPIPSHHITQLESNYYRYLPTYLPRCYVDFLQVVDIIS